MRYTLVVASLIWSTTCIAHAKVEDRLKPQTSFFVELGASSVKKYSHR